MSEILNDSPTTESDALRVGYLFDEVESTALDSVFNFLFELVEKEVNMNNR